MAQPLPPPLQTPKDFVHIYPVTGRLKSDHRVDKTDTCWCQPVYKQPCSEQDDQGQCQKTCWRCQGEGIADPYDEALGWMLVHKEGQFLDA